MCNLQRKLVWLLLFWRPRGPRHCIWRRSWYWSVSQSYFQIVLWKHWAQSRVTLGGPVLGRVSYAALGILGPVSLQQRILLPWGIRTFADMWCFHLSLEGSVSLVIHNRIWTAACWGDRKLNRRNVGVLWSAAQWKRACGDGQVPVKHWSFNRHCRSGSMLGTGMPIEMEGRNHTLAEACVCGIRVGSQF